MIDIKRLLKAERMEVTYLETDIDKRHIIGFRKAYNLTQVALANILGVKTRNINRWELDKSKMGGSSAVLFTIIVLVVEVLLYEKNECN